VKEDEIYLLTKKWIIGFDFQILGGQPPNGTDRFPVIEIKSDDHEQKGSQRSFKPDLVVATESELIVVECKPRFSDSDVAKLREISESNLRINALIREIRQRRSLERRSHGLATLSDSQLAKRTRFCVAYSGVYQPISDIYSLVFNENGSGVNLHLGSKILQGFTEFA
jgi:hypothetical protein